MKEKTICVFCGREEEQGVLTQGTLCVLRGHLPARLQGL